MLSSATPSSSSFRPRTEASASPGSQTPEPLIVVIVGPSGVGKGAVTAGLVARVAGLWLSRSWTTRSRRVSDAEDSYVFVDRPAFEAERDAGGFLEWAEVFGSLYGTPVPAPPPGTDLLLEIDVQGAGQVKRLRPDSVVVCVRAPSRAAQEQRLRLRGDEEAVIARRIALADAEEEAGLALADHVVVNDNLEDTIAEMLRIIGHARSPAAPAGPSARSGASAAERSPAARDRTQEARPAQPAASAGGPQREGYVDERGPSRERSVDEGGHDGRAPARDTRGPASDREHGGHVTGRPAEPHDERGGHAGSGGNTPAILALVLGIAAVASLVVSLGALFFLALPLGIAAVSYTHLTLPTIYSV